MSIEAFDIAERLQTPVIFMSDLDIGMNDWVVDELELEDTHKFDRGKVLSAKDLDAIEMLKNEGINIGFVEIKLLHPFPKELLKKSFSNSKTIIDVEANYTGQLGSIIKQNLEKDPDYYILKYTGRPMTCTELYDTLKKIVNNNAQKREVLTYGA